MTHNQPSSVPMFHRRSLTRALAGGVTESIKVMNLEAQQDQAWKAIFGDTDNSIRKLKQKLRELREADGV